MGWYRMGSTPPGRPTRHFPGIVPEHDHLHPLGPAQHPSAAGPMKSPLLLGDTVLFPGMGARHCSHPGQCFLTSSSPALSVEVQGLWTPSCLGFPVQLPAQFSGPKGGQAFTCCRGDHQTCQVSLQVILGQQVSDFQVHASHREVVTKFQ